MKVFLSWSGNKSRVAAEALRDWLPYVINAVEPWMSAEDIEAGARWSNAIQTELAETRFGILFATGSNINAPWLLFEAGALAKTLEETFVCPYLIDIRPTDIPGGPLTQFQAKQSDQPGTWQLVQTINRSLAEKAIPVDRLECAFEMWWPELERKFAELPADDDVPPSGRGVEDMVEEILGIARRLDRSNSDSTADFGPTLRKLREEKGLSQAEVADQVGVSQVFISQLERGMNRPGSDITRRLYAIFGSPITRAVRGS